VSQFAIRRTIFLFTAAAIIGVGCGDPGPSADAVESAFSARGIELHRSDATALPPQTTAAAAVKTVYVGGQTLIRGTDVLASESRYSQVEVIFTDSKADAEKAIRGWNSSRVGSGHNSYWARVNGVVLLYSEGGNGYALSQSKLLRNAKAAMHDLGVR
jgi:hypothetical protein